MLPLRLPVDSHITGELSGSAVQPPGLIPTEEDLPGLLPECRSETGSSYGEPPVLIDIDECEFDPSCESGRWGLRSCATWAVHQCFQVGAHDCEIWPCRRMHPPRP